MKLLVITQRVDKKDPILGAYHRWIEEFEKNVEKVTVICLELGESTLSENIKVLSLGKEKRRSKIQYLKNFYKYIWQERKNYDTVFVHMNEEYVLLAGLWWRLLGKRVGMFRNHIHGTWKTPMAVALSNVVFCTSPNSFTARYKKTIIVPAGTNVEKFRYEEEPHRIPLSILSMGRVDPVKNIDLLIKALEILDRDGVDFKAKIVGDPDPKNRDYYEEIVRLGAALVSEGKLQFSPAVPNPETPKEYRSHIIFANMTNSGSFDKTILSAMASGQIVVLSNESFRSVVPDSLIFKELDAVDLAKKLRHALDMGPEEVLNLTRGMRKYVDDHHSLEATIAAVLKALDAK